MSDAIKHLSSDPIMEGLIKLYGPLDKSLKTNLYDDLISSIISQQLSVKAADTISKRFIALFENKYPTPAEILNTPDDTIRACGISYPKIKYIKGIAEAIINKTLDLDSLTHKPDEVVLDELIKLKGVGKWTAEMILIFSLKREDVFSLGDIGLRNAVAKLYKVDRDNIIEIEKISLAWSPYRSSAARYLWKSLDNTPSKQV